MTDKLAYTASVHYFDEYEEFNIDIESTTKPRIEGGCLVTIGEEGVEVINPLFKVYEVDIFENHKDD